MHEMVSDSIHSPKLTITEIMQETFLVIIHTVETKMNHMDLNYVYVNLADWS
jgi:hypothetical protein